MMKRSSVCAVMVLTALVFLPLVISARHISRQHSHHDHHHQKETSKRETMGMSKADNSSSSRPAVMLVKKQRRATDTVQIAGSRLPDCSHACGSCRPCRLVMVSFVCASIEEAETCPMAYKCMCNNKSYPVP